jgi:outer membrane protein, multidrug efflux system
MRSQTVFTLLGIAMCAWVVTSCIPSQLAQPDSHAVPNFYAGRSSGDSSNTGLLTRNQFFSDSNLVALIDTALLRNQELNIALQEVNIAQYELRMRTGEYLPFVSGGVGAGLEHTPRYTRNGAVENQLEVAPNHHFPEPLANLQAGFNVSWEVDIWRKLRNAKQAALQRYYATQEGRKSPVHTLN